MGNLNIEHLNPAQQEAVTYNEGPMMVLAGAGSGKTRTLVTKIAYLLQQGISPHRILALTFSNKAAKEMKDRVASELHFAHDIIPITTFHSYCARLLRKEVNYLGIASNFTIYDQSDSKAVVKGVLEQNGINTKEISPYEIMYFVENLHNLGHYPRALPHAFRDEVDTTDEYYPFYLQYMSELTRSNALDFGALIVSVIKLFEEFPEVLTRYRERYQYILVDEYQDTNRAQFQLLQLLSQGENSTVCVVGDEDQSIYSWRGADIRNILDFEKLFPATRYVKLEQNYRSTQKIINAASEVIAHNQERKGKTMWTDNSTGEVIDIYECANEKAEAQKVVQTIKEIVARGTDYKDVAIFYRGNAQARVIEEELRYRNLPYRVIGGVKFYDRKEIKDVLAYMRLVVNERDSLALARIINVPARGIGATTLRKIEKAAIAHDHSLLRMIKNINDGVKVEGLRLTQKMKDGITRLVALFSEVDELYQMQSSLHEIAYRIIHNSGIYSAYQKEASYEAKSRLENLDEFLSATRQFEHEWGSREGNIVNDFLEQISLDAPQNQDERGEISLMTVHGAKGLEFPYVFLVGAEESLFPSHQSIEGGPLAIEEERRLFYVAMTRAMKRLYISFARGRMLFGEVRFNGASRFLHEIPQEYYSWHNETQKVQKSFFLSPQEKKRPPIQQDKVFSLAPRPDRGTYKKGQKIKHKLYGAGTVLSCEGEGRDEKVSIRFAQGGVKKFMVHVAPLSKL